MYVPNIRHMHCKTKKVFKSITKSVIGSNALQEESKLNQMG